METNHSLNQLVSNTVEMDSPVLVRPLQLTLHETETCLHAALPILVIQAMKFYDGLLYTKDYWNRFQ